MTNDLTTTGTTTTGTRRPLLWVLLIVALVANGATSLAGLPVVVSASLGALALAAGALLVRDHYRHRARS